MALAILLLVLAPLWVSALLVAVTFPLAWWIFPGGGSRGPDDTLASRILGNLLVVLAEWLSVAWVIAVFPYRFYRNDGPRRNLPSGRVPVVILPGHSENAMTMLFMERRLERALGVPVRALSPVGYFTGIERIAEGFRSEIHAWLDELDADQVDLVGHSLGGIAARHLAESGALKNRIRRVVSVGSPHLGSALSVLLPGRNARQLRRGSAYLEALNGSPAPRSVRYSGICSTHDNIVLPWHCALSPRGDNFIIRYRGHVTLLLSREVVRLVARELKSS